MRPYRSIREKASLYYILDGQEKWNKLDSEERYGSLEMARWALMDADVEELEDDAERYESEYGGHDGEGDVQRFKEARDELLHNN